MATKIKKETKPKSIKTNSIISLGALGKEIKISPKSLVWENAEGFKMEFFTKTIDIIIGIGKDHHATLIMDVESWEALRSGEAVSITTYNEYLNGYVVKPTRKKKALTKSTKNKTKQS